MKRNVLFVKDIEILKKSEGVFKQKHLSKSIPFQLFFNDHCPFPTHDFNDIIKILTLNQAHGNLLYVALVLNLHA